MINKSILEICSIIILVFVMQIFIPAFEFSGIPIVADINLLMLTYIGFYYGRFYSIILGFLIGFFQDIFTQIELVGVMAFTKSAISFGLGTLKLYQNIWSYNSKLLFIFAIYNLHYFIFYFIKFNGLGVQSIVFFKIIILNSCISFIIFLIIDRFVFYKGIIQNAKI
tara:strand:+ start:1103 stop:1603 length:501 start_codon:yes stop_codon:yes gene_type:complete